MTKRYEKPVLHGLDRREVDAVRSGQVEITRLIQLRQDRQDRENRGGVWWGTGDVDIASLSDVTGVWVGSDTAIHGFPALSQWIMETWPGWRVSMGEHRWQMRYGIGENNGE